MFGDKIICHKCNDIKIWKKKSFIETNVSIKFLN